MASRKKKEKEKEKEKEKKERKRKGEKARERARGELWIKNRRENRIKERKRKPRKRREKKFRANREKYIREKYIDEFRVGIGFDIHRFSSEESKKLVLGQVEIDFRGLEGASSDVDVLLHAISDAILGASGNKDIGILFPPESSKGISSREILEKAKEMAEKSGFSLQNVDSVIIAEKPKLGDKIEKMKENISRTLKCDVNLKVKSPEGLGTLGRVEGIAVISVALLRKKANSNERNK